MLLWLVIALGFVVCVIAWNIWQGITWSEALALFIMSSILFEFNMLYIYKETTTDYFQVSGYVTSLTHRPAFSYRCGKHTCYEEECWIVEQQPHQAKRVTTLKRSLHSGDGVDECRGECLHEYPVPFCRESSIKRELNKAGGCEGWFGDCYDNYPTPYIIENSYAFRVNKEKYWKTDIGFPSSVWQSYFNSVRVSGDIVYNETENIPYFQLDDFNFSHRLIAPKKTPDQEVKLGLINAEFAPRNIAVGLIITQDPLYFEKLKRAWHLGKANDFVIVISTLDGQTISNVNVLSWYNYELIENVSKSIMALGSTDIDPILSVLHNALLQGPAFTPAKFSKYTFLDVKIPQKYYYKIIFFQILFLAYTLILFHFNPNTKEHKLTWVEIYKLWKKDYHPPHLNWYLHPLSPLGLILHIIIPLGFLSFIVWGPLFH